MIQSIQDFLYFIAPHVYLPIKVWCIIWFLTNFEPYKIARDEFFDGFESKYPKLIKSIIWNSIRILFTCPTCLTFWITLCLSQSFIMAVVLAYCAKQLDWGGDDDTVDLSKYNK